MKRKTSKTRRRTQPNVLQVKVMSPRLAWLGLLRFLGRLTKLACVLAVLAGAGWGVWRGIHHTFYSNPDFRLQVIDLNDNLVVNEMGLVKLAGIDLTKSPSLFDVDIDKTRQKLLALPAIKEAHVERKLPGTLVVRVVPRTPKAWIAEKGCNLQKVRRANGLLIDPAGFVYPCPKRQLHVANKLPILLVTADPGHPITAGCALDHPELQNCLNLLEAVRKTDPESTHWIQSISQTNEWSLLLVTRQGTAATFGLTDHQNQIKKLRAALNHAASKGYQIATINLIPRFNVPITVRGDRQAPRAIPVSEVSRHDSSKNLSSLLQSH